MQHQQQGKKHRSHTELIASVLEAAASVQEGELRTRIQYKASTSHIELRGYLEDVTRHDLLKYENRSCSRS